MRVRACALAIVCARAHVCMCVFNHLLRRTFSQWRFLRRERKINSEIPGNKCIPDVLLSACVCSPQMSALPPIPSELVIHIQSTCDYTEFTGNVTGESEERVYPDCKLPVLVTSSCTLPVSVLFLGCLPQFKQPQPAVTKNTDLSYIWGERGTNLIEVFEDINNRRKIVESLKVKKKTTFYTK